MPKPPAVPITLYHGNNYAHEFYETDRATKPYLLIIRNLEEDFWFVLAAKPKFPLPAPGPLSAVIREIASAMRCTIAIDPHREYVYGPDGRYNMQLVEVRGDA